MAAGMWAGLADMAMEGVDYVTDAVGMGDGKAVDAASSIAGQVGYDTLDSSVIGPEAMKSASSLSQVSSLAHGAIKTVEDPESWVGDVLKPAMSSILGAAMKPKPTAHAGMGGAGHGVSASGGTAMQPFNEITKMADSDPLDGLNKWVGIFG